MMLFVISAMAVATVASATLTGKTYNTGDRVPLFVDSVISSDFGGIFYYNLPFCTPPEGIRNIPQNIVQIILGHKLQDSPYEISMRKEVTCKVLCEQNNSLEWAIAKTIVQRGYRVRFFTEEGLPALPDTQGHFGTPLGTTDESGNEIINRHLRITFQYHPKDQGQAFIVGLRIQSSPLACNGTWSYEVHWEESAIRWASRWDAYAGLHNQEVDYKSTTYSVLLIVTLLTAVSGILTRTVHRDLLTQEAKEEDSPIGWKNLRQDVYRPVCNPKLFAEIIGSGTFMLVSTTMILIIGALSFMFIADRVWFIGIVAISVVIASFIGGYFAGSAYHTVSSHKDKTYFMNLTLASTSTLLVVCPFMVLVFLRHVYHGGEAVASEFYGIIVIWLGIFMPSTFAGACWGNRDDGPSLPYSERPRQIPPSKPETHLGVAILCTGFCTFCTFAIQLYYILPSLWYGHTIAKLGLLLGTLLITLITASLCTIVFCYFHLQQEDYGWRWRSLITSGSGAIWVFISCSFWAACNVHEESLVVFMIYSLVFSFSFFLCTSVVGYFATRVFVRHIYSRIKLD